MGGLAEHHQEPEPDGHFRHLKCRDLQLPVRGVVGNGANAGNLQLQWAQGVASASNLTVKGGSSLVLTPLT